MRTAALLASLLVVAAACSSTGTAEQILESQEGVGNVEIDEGGGLVTIESEDGEASVVVGGGDLPDDFPVPVPPRGTVLAIFQEGPASSARIEYPADQYEMVASFYKDFSTSAGIEIGDVSSRPDPPFTSWFLKHGDQVYTIVVLGSGGVTQVQVNVTPAG